MIQGSGIQAPDVVTEGGSFEVTVEFDSGKITVSVGSTGEVFDVPVSNGRARVTLPSNVKGGALLTIINLASKNREGVTVEVVAQD